MREHVIERTTTTGRIAAACALAMALAMAGTGLVGQAQAAGAERGDRGFDTRRTAAMRDGVYQDLAEARELADQEQFAEAMELLERMMARKGLNDYERGMSLNFRAYVHYAQQDYDGAIAAYREILALPEAPESLITQTLYSLAQMYFVTERYAQALGPLERWFRLTDEPGASAWVMLGQAYYQLERLDQARRAVEEAVGLAEAGGGAARQNWYLLLRAIYYAQEDYDALLAVMKKLVEQHPGKGDYWVQLAAVYGELGREKEQLATLWAAYEAAFVTRERDLVSLAQLLLSNKAPYKAALVLESGLDEGLVAPDGRNLKMLADAWILAKEHERAVQALQRAAEISGDGDLYLRLAQVQLDRDAFAESVAAARESIARGGLERPGTAHVVMGLALYNLDRLDEAREAFRQARAMAESEEIARQWLAYLERESGRRVSLARALETSP